MNIYIEFSKLKLRVGIGKENIDVLIPANFYSPIPGTESFYMFHDKATNNQLKDLVGRHRDRLGFFGKVRYWFFRNAVFSLIDTETQTLTTIAQIYSYAALVLDARIIWIIKKPLTFDSTNLQDIEKIKRAYINRGRVRGDVLISKIEAKH